MNKEEFNNLEVKDQIDFINKELEKIGYVYDKQSNKYIENSINKDLGEVNNIINTKLLF